MNRLQRLIALSIPVLLVSLILVAPTPAVAGDWTGDANIFLGQKQLKKSDWEPWDSQAEGGAEVSWGKKSWPILIATDVLGSADEQTVLGVKTTVSTSELDLGVRKIWASKNIRPYVGGGVGTIGVRTELKSPIDQTHDDSSVGFWFGGGVFWRLGRRFNIGFSARWSQAKVTLVGTDLEAGGVHAGLLLGWGWPASK